MRKYFKNFLLVFVKVKHVTDAVLDAGVNQTCFWQCTLRHRGFQTLMLCSSVTDLESLQC